MLDTLASIAFTPTINVFSFSFDQGTLQEDGTVLFSGLSTCENCDIGSARMESFNKPVRVATERGNTSLLYVINSTDAYFFSFPASSLDSHRVSFSYKANITSTNEEGAYIYFGFGENGGSCDFGFVINATGIQLPEKHDEEAISWDLAVTEGGWNRAILDVGPCQELQSNAIFMIYVTSTPLDWGSISIKDISVYKVVE